LIHEVEGLKKEINHDRDVTPTVHTLSKEVKDIKDELNGRVDRVRKDMVEDFEYAKDINHTVKRVDQELAEYQQRCKYMVLQLKYHQNYSQSVYEAFNQIFSLVSKTSDSNEPLKLAPPKEFGPYRSSEDRKSGYSNNFHQQNYHQQQHHQNYNQPQQASQDPQQNQYNTRRNREDTIFKPFQPTTQSANPSEQEFGFDNQISERRPNFHQNQRGGRFGSRFHPYNNQNPRQQHAHFNTRDQYQNQPPGGNKFRPRQDYQNRNFNNNNDGSYAGQSQNAFSNEQPSTQPALKDPVPVPTAPKNLKSAPKPPIPQSKRLVKPKPTEPKKVLVPKNPVPTSSSSSRENEESYVPMEITTSSYSAPKSSNKPQESDCGDVLDNIDNFADYEDNDEDEDIDISKDTYFKRDNPHTISSTPPSTKKQSQRLNISDIYTG